MAATSRHGGRRVLPIRTRPLAIVIALVSAIGVAMALVTSVSLPPTRPALAATNENLLAPSQLSITDLGTLPGREASEANDINDRGQVVGFSRTASYSDHHAFLWENGEMTDLGALPGTDRSEASDINNRGQVVGYGITASGDFHAVLWTD